MSIAAFILLTVLMQFAIFTGYPDTGPLGLAFIAVSVGVWSAYHVVIKCALFSARETTRTGMYILGVMASLLATAMFLPQRGGISVFDKISLGQYPTKASVYIGLGKLGIDFPAWKPPDPKFEPVVL